MKTNIEFTMSDGLLIKGTLLGNKTSSNLIIMLHSGGYNHLERGVEKVINTPDARKIIYYNNRGNYEYLTAELKEDAMILLIDQRNHGESGKNIDIPKMLVALKKISDFDNSIISNIINSLLKKDKDTLKKIVASLPLEDSKKVLLQELLKRPILKDMSFIKMQDDLSEVIEQMQTLYQFSAIHLVGTCMGGLVSTLYALNNPNMVKSLTLFSPLFTFDYSFFHPSDDFTKNKLAVIAAGRQHRMGNAVEGPKTIEEITKIKKDFYDRLNNLDIPIFCIQGLEDTLVPARDQNVIFKELKTYHDKYNLSPIYYAEIKPGVHCLYDTLFPSLIEATTFIVSNLNTDVLKK